MEKKQNLFTPLQQNRIVLIITLLVAGFLVYTSSGLLTAFLGAIVFYTLFRKMNITMIEKKKIRPSVSSLIILVFSFFIIVIPIFGVLSMIASKVTVYVNQDHIALSGLISTIDSFFAEHFNQPHFTATIFSSIKSVALNLFSSAVGQVSSSLLSLSVMYFVLYYMFANYKWFEQTIFDLTPFNEQDSLEFGKELHNSTYSNILGQGIIALAQGFLLTIGFWIFGVSDALFWGVITVILSFLPIVGAALVYVPAAAILLFSDEIGAGLGLLAFGFIIVSSIDNVLRFFISKNYAKTHPVITIIGVIIGIPMFGIVGLVFGPLLISFFLLLLRVYRKNRLRLMAAGVITATPVIVVEEQLSNDEKL